MTRERISLLASALVLALMGGFVWANFSVTTDVTLLLPPDADRELLGLTRRVADSELGRTMVLTLGAPDADTAVRASHSFERELRGETRVAPQLLSLEGGPNPGTERAVYDLYHPRRFGFVAPSPAAARALVEPAALRAAAVRLKAELAQPMSPLISRLAPSDPLLVLAGLFQRLERSQSNALAIRDGRFVTRDGRFAALFLRTRAAAFDSEAQAPVLTGVQAAFARVNARFRNALTLDQSGVNRFAVRAERSIRGDIARVSTLSMIGLGLLLFLVFRSFVLVAAASVPLGAGFLVGLTACLAVYGKVHGITLAFGSSLLGVALDYVEHLYCHQAVSPNPDGARGTLRKIGPALLTGAATTLVGFLALGGSGFRGLEEVALFSSTGLIGALLATFTMLPALLPASTPRVRLRERMVAALASAFVRLRARRRVLWLLPAAAIGAAAIGLPRVQLSEDFTLGQLDADLLAEDQRVRDRVARFDQMRFVVATGKDAEAALAVNDRVGEALEASVMDGQLGGYLGTSALLPSAARQQSVAAAVRDALGDGSQLVAAFEREGFRAEAFAPFRAALAAPAPAPLTFEELAKSPLAPMVRPFRLELADGVAFMTFLHGVADPAALQARLAAIGGARFVDQQAQFKRAHVQYQRRTLAYVLAGSLGVLVLLALRYRNPRKTLAAFVPSLLSAAVTVAVLAWTGRKLDLVALAALLMVLSMGVDYGVFLVDANETEAEPTTALLSVFFAATTSVLGFGLLALSKHPLLSMIGLTSWVGMTLCALLAPTTLVLLGPGRRVP
jgi:predicted exporter